MLRPNFRKLDPHHKREMRHWAIELVVVVVGVLLALWAAEWAEGQREEQRLAELEMVMRDELAENYIHAIIDGGTDSCILRDLAGLRTRLIASDDSWEGVETLYRSNLENGVEIELGVFAVRPTLYLLGSWDTAQQSGLIARMPQKKMDLYRAAFASSERLYEARRELEGRRDALSLLIFPGQLSPEMRAEALRNVTIATLAIGRRTHHTDLGFFLNELEISLSAQQSEELASVAQYSSRILGSCFVMPEIVVSTEDREV